MHKSILDTVGNTPLVGVPRIAADLPATVLVKVEYFNPLSSVKDRIGLAMVRDAESRGLLGPGALLIEPTSGNTGIALAFVAAARGYGLILTMPDSASVERMRLLRHLGARVELTPGPLAMLGAVERARAIQREHAGAVTLQQFDNPANPAAHEATTGPEIWRDTEGSVDIFVAGVGTGGTISGVSRFLKRQKADIRAVAVEPDASAVLSGKPPGQHPIEGIGAGFVPSNFDRTVVDDIVTVRGEDAFKMARRLAMEEGILAGISSGANVHAAVDLARRPENEGKTIVTVIASCGERYLSTPLFR
ncbi:MAG: cysteine synthase A [Myxococcales bacterium]|nr:cysteine synthase A [Myxococcales bacterium]MCB9521388.1 cysteine synthase A [Myxococcales bacterium]MCB9532573.1 cysteine synthase A [Myxococcales bacterium]MCB9533799.1 cysteine synthase A [Myxococcales bacterium]